MITAEQPEVIARWVQARIPDCAIFDNPAAFGVLRGGRLAAGILFHRYDARAGDIEIVLAADSPRWATRQVFWTTFAFAFLQLGCRRVSARVNASNKRARRLIEGAGFVLEGLLRSAGHDHGDVLIYGMLREECRWLDLSFGPREGLEVPVDTPARRLV